MTKLKLPSGEYLLVEVSAIPAGATYSISAVGFICCNHYGRRDTISSEQLYSKCTIIGLASAITEDVAAGIVTELPIGNRWPSYDQRVWQYTPSASLYSLVRSHGYEPEHCLILKNH